MIKRTIAAAFAVGLLLLPSMATAQDQDTEEASDDDEIAETRFGIGFQTSIPAWGISGMMNFSPQVSGQAMIGLAGTVQNLTGRVIYRFTRESRYSVYGYGLAGVWTYTGGLSNQNEAAVGGGAGVEYDLRGLGEELPPLFFNLEIGMAIADFQGYSFNTVTMGSGVHYRF